MNRLELGCSDVFEETHTFKLYCIVLFYLGASLCSLLCFEDNMSSAFISLLICLQDDVFDWLIELL